MLNFDWLAATPVATARLIFLGLFALIVLLIWLLPREYIYESVENPRWWHNLKLWATGALAIMGLLYSVF